MTVWIPIYPLSREGGQSISCWNHNILITNVVNIYELNLGFFYSPKKRSRSYDWKGLDQNKGLGIMTRNFLYLMTMAGIIHILLI